MTMNVTTTAPKTSPHRNAFVNPSTATTTTIVAAVAGKRYRVLSVAVISTLANNVNFASSTFGAISATFPLGANGGLVLPFNEHGWFETVVGEGLQVTTSAATAAGIQVQYIELLGAPN